MRPSLRLDATFKTAYVYGFGLVELLVVLAIVAILAVAAVPSLMSLVSAVQLRVTADTLVQGLAMARSEAIKRNTRVVICKSRSGRVCETAGGWEAGWLIFQDSDNDGQLGSDEFVIHRQGGFVEGWMFSANSPVANYVSYTPLGTSRYTSGGFQAGTFTVCQKSPETSVAQDIVLSNTGRARVAKRDISRCPEI